VSVIFGVCVLAVVCSKEGREGGGYGGGRGTKGHQPQVGSMDDRQSSQALRFQHLRKVGSEVFGEEEDMVRREYMLAAGMSEMRKAVWA